MGRTAKWVVLLGGFSVVLVFMECIIPFDFLGALLLGWGFYLARVVPQIRVNGSSVLFLVACLASFTAGLHAFSRWLYGAIAGGDSARSWKPRWTMSVVAVLMLMFVAGTAATGVAHQTGWLLVGRQPLIDRTSDRFIGRVRSTHNLRQIGVAVHAYVEDQGAYPPGGTMDSNGRMRHGWQALLLPYLDGQQELASRIDYNVPWDDPRNAPAFQTVIPEFSDPNRKRTTHSSAGFALSYYAGNARVLGGTGSLTEAEVTDGTSQTLLAGEVAEGAKPWGDPANWRDPALGVNRSAQGFGSRSSDGANFLFMDGSVRFIKNKIKPELLRGLSTPAGGERLTSDEY